MEELGRDPQGSRRIGDHIDLRVYLEDEVYRKFRTHRLISDKLVETVNGPGTREWVVQEVRGYKLVGPHLTLTESWVEEDRAREGDIIRALWAARPSDEVHAKMIDKYFLHLVCYGDSYVRKRLDHTENLLLHGAPPPPASARYYITPPPTRLPKDDSDKQVQGDHEGMAEQCQDTIAQETLPTITPLPRVRHRTVYYETFEPLYSERDLSNIFNHLCGACVGVFYSLAYRLVF